MTLLKEEAPGNSVPAAAVIQGGQVLFFVIRRKGSVGYLISYGLNPIAQLWVGFKTILFEFNRG